MADFQGDRAGAEAGTPLSAPARELSAPVFKWRYFGVHDLTPQAHRDFWFIEPRGTETLRGYLGNEHPDSVRRS